MEHDGTRTLAHPVVGAVAALGAVLDQVAQAPVWSMTGEDQLTALQQLARVEARLAEVKLRVVRQAEVDATGGTVGAASTAAWWATHTQQTKPGCHRQVRLARALDTDFYQPLRQALAAGVVWVDQAEAVVKAVDALPTDLVDAATRARARDHLIGLAADHDALALTRLGRHVLEVLAPEVADQALADQLEKQEARARERTRLTSTDDGRGLTHLKGALPTEVAQTLRKQLMAIAAPKHQHAVGGSHFDAGGELKPMPLRLGEALCEYVTRYRADHVARAGGLPATVVVTMDLATLMGGIKPAVLDTGHSISAGRARMIACEAGIVPAVLGGRSEVLDLGRARRFHTPAQRLALGLEQGGCTARGCDRPPGGCHVHHDEPWHRGGHTNTRSSRLVWPPRPRPHPRPQIPDHLPPRRHDLLPPTDIDRHQHARAVRQDLGPRPPGVPR